MSSNWPIKRLGDCCEKIGSGATPKGGKEAYLDAGLTCLIRSQNIYNDGFKASGLAFISEEQARKLNNVTVESGDVLLNITGDSVARVCQMPDEYIPARVNQHVAIIRPKPTEFDASFVRYFLASPTQQDLMLGLASAGATRSALTKVMIEAFEIPCPSLGVQKAIAAILGSLDERITLLKESNKTLEAMARAIFKSWFVDFDPVLAKSEGKLPEGMNTETAALFPDKFDETEFGAVPQGWKNVSLKEVVSIYDSKRIPLSGQQRESRKGNYPYYGAAALMDFVDDYLFDGIYLLTGEDGSVADEQGFPVMQYVWGKFWVNNHAHILQGKNGISTEHVFLALQKTNIAPYITGAVQPKLSQANMWRINFLKPTQDLSECFSRVIQPIFERFRHNAEQAQNLATLRDTLLPRLISGQLSVNEAERESTMV